VNYLSFIALYFRTIRHLKIIQIFARIKFKLFTPKLDTCTLPSRSFKFSSQIQSARRETNLFGPNNFILLNQPGDCNDIGWQDQQRSKLWRYNQHYFDDLNAIDAKLRKVWHLGLIDSWINENPPSVGVGWEPYPTSLRIVNWIKWDNAQNQITNKMSESLALQARWLSKRIEWHLLGNHLFANAKALIYAGLYFEGKEARQWLSMGFQILKSQVKEQILIDGGQFELSPMYHALALEDLLDLTNICQNNSHQLTACEFEQLRSWPKIIVKMLNWLKAVSHPDGKISFFNDAAFSIAPENNELISYAKRLGFVSLNPNNGVTDLKHSGLVRLQTDKAVVIFDSAKIAPDYLPGHAHADTLSFEFSIDSQRIFVNSGTSVYGLGKERLRQRGTAAHNTVIVNAQNSSEVWSGFRVGNRARILERESGIEDSEIYAHGTHDGYARKNGGLLHTRKLYLSENSLRVSDIISKPLSADVRYHLHPDIQICCLEGKKAVLIMPNGKKIKLIVDGAKDFNFVQSTWHPEFGASVQSKCLVVKFEGYSCKLVINWD